jgi:hypothetical protein
MRTHPKQTNLGKAPRFAIRRIERGHAPAGNDLTGRLPVSGEAARLWLRIQSRSN